MIHFKCFKMAALTRRLKSKVFLADYFSRLSPRQISTLSTIGLSSSCHCRSVGRARRDVFAAVVNRCFVNSSCSCISFNYTHKPISRFLSNFSTTDSKVTNLDIKNAEQWVQDYLSQLCERIKKELSTQVTPLQNVSHYYFDGQGKYIRPMIVLLMATTCNIQTNSTRKILPSQETVAMISEMIHTASLIHDDVIDGADTRRGKVAVNKAFGDKNCVLAGDYILSSASQALAKLGNAEVVKLLAEVVEDLVRGEFMQLGSKEDPDERFSHYLKKTYKKTASLIACCCRAVAIFPGCSPEVQEIAYQYGKNIGMAFQLVDDLLDFVASENEMGKATAADLKLGLATAPVLFACEKFPELNAMIMRRFKEPGDVEFTRQAVYDSDSISRTYDLANQYSKEAVRQINKLQASPEQQLLITITSKVISRRK